MPANDFVATRTLSLSGTVSGQAIVSIGKPAPEGEDYRCEFQILGLGDVDINSYGMGADSMQALMLTLKMIGTRLYTSHEYKHGRLKLEGSRNLDFPVPDNIADVLPED